MFWIGLAWIAMPLFVIIGVIRERKWGLIQRLLGGVFFGLLIGFLAGCALAFEHWFGYTVFWILFAFTALAAIGPVSSANVSAPDNSQAVDESSQESLTSTETAQTNATGRLPISSQKKLRKLNRSAKVPTKKAIYQIPAVPAKSSEPFKPSKTPKHTRYSRSEVRQIAFGYIDSSGSFTSREVAVNSFDGTYLKAFCLEKGATRTFKLENICGLITLRETGEQLRPKEWQNVWFES